LANTEEKFRYKFLLTIENWKQRKLFGKRCCFKNTDTYGSTPLILVALEDKREVFPYPTEIGAIIIITIISNAKDDRAFHSAGLLDSVDIIILLPDKVMSVNLTNTK